MTVTLMDNMIVQAITTKYIGPSNTRSGRIKASAAAGSVTIPYPSQHGMERAHATAALALCEKLGWSGTLAQGGMPSDSGYAFVFTGRC
jgi:hypothetical protein